MIFELNLPVFCNVGREFIRNLSKWKNIEVSSTKPGSSTVMFIKTLQIVTIAYNEFITCFHESLIYETWYFSMEFVQLNKYETAPKFYLIKPKLDIGLFVDFWLLCFYQFLRDVIIELFCFDLQNNFIVPSCKNW